MAQLRCAPSESSSSHVNRIGNYPRLVFHQTAELCEINLNAIDPTLCHHVFLPRCSVFIANRLAVFDEEDTALDGRRDNQSHSVQQLYLIAHDALALIVLGCIGEA